MKIKVNHKQAEKWNYKIRDLCKLFVDHKITFSIVLAELKKRNIIYGKKE